MSNLSQLCEVIAIGLIGLLTAASVYSRYAEMLDLGPFSNSIAYGPPEVVTRLKSSKEKEMRKGLLLGVLAVFAAALLLLVLFLSHKPTPGVTRENFYRLHKGMTEEEAAAIMGSPPYYGGGVTLRHWGGWTQNGLHISISVSDGWSPNAPKPGPWITHGTMTNPDGSTETIPDDNELFVTKFRRWLGVY